MCKKMKVLLYSENQKLLRKSGIGRAFSHQMKALDHAGVSYTLDKKDSFDIIHINTLFKRSYKFMRKMQKKGYPVIAHGHSTKQDFARSFALYRFITPWFNWRLQKMYTNADMIITPTLYSKYLIETTPRVNCPVIAISNGIDLHEYAFKEENVKAFRQHFNLKPDQKVVIGVGLLFERKGIHNFFYVARMLPEYTFIWFGHLNPLITANYVKAAIKKRPSNVIMAGYVSGNVIKGAFSGANACFFPSYEETEGIVVLEALASKLPTVVREIPVYSDWLTKDVHVLKGHNNEEFKDLLVKACEEDMTEMVEEGYKVVSERSIDQVGLQLKTAYDKLLWRHEENKKSQR